MFLWDLVHRSSLFFQRAVMVMGKCYKRACVPAVCRTTNSQTKQQQRRQAQMRPAEVAVHACRACVVPPTAASGCWSTSSSALGDRGAACGTAKRTHTHIHNCRRVVGSSVVTNSTVSILSKGRTPSWACQVGEMVALTAPTQRPAAGC